jgi:hypothetical protein
VANAGGLALVLLAGFVGLLLAGGAVALLLWGLLARDPRRGLRVSKVALAFSLLASFLSFPFFRVVLSGRDSHGQPLHYGESLPIVAVVVVNVLAVVLSIAGVVRQARRTRPPT